MILASMLAIPDGSLVFLEHSNNIVENETGSPITHVGIYVDGYIYEAVKPRVRKITVEEFKKKNKKYNIYFKSPVKEFNKQELAKIKDYLEDQVKRKYSVWGYITGHNVKGIHCGELVANALSSSGRYTFKEPWDITPGELWTLEDYQTLSGF